MAGLRYEPSAPDALAEAPLTKTPRTVWMLPIVGASGDIATVDSAAALRAMDEAIDWYDRAAGDPSVRVFVLAGALDPIALPEPAPTRKERPCADIEEALRTASAAMPDNPIVVGLVAIPRACPYAGLAPIDGNWAIATGYNPATSEVPVKTIVHELGHTLGLPHAKRYLCAIQTSGPEPADDPRDCGIEEYGDPADPMGEMPRVVTAGFNPFSLSELGWGQAPIRIDEPGERQVFLPPVDASGPDYLALPNRLAVSFRDAPLDNRERSVDKGIGKSRKTEKIHGVFIHEFPPDADPSPGSVLMPFSPHSPAGQVGDHYVSEDGLAAVRVDKIVPGQGAWITVLVGSPSAPVVDRWGPSIQVRTAKIDKRSMLIGVNVHDQSGVVSVVALHNGRPVNVGNGGFVTLTRPDTGEPPDTVTVYARDSRGNTSSSTATITAPRARPNVPEIP